MKSSYDVLSIFVIDNMIFRKSKTVELQNDDFLKIDIILQINTNEIFLQNCRFRKTKKLEKIVSVCSNDVNWIEKIYFNEFFVNNIISKDHVIRIQQLRLINKIYQSLNVFHSMKWFFTFMLYRDERILFCKTKYKMIHENHIQKAKKNLFDFVEKCVRDFYSLEINEKHWKDSTILKTIKQDKSFDHLCHNVNIITFIKDKQTTISSSRCLNTKQYNFDDCFDNNDDMFCETKMIDLYIK